jgi:2-keto-3-deoxy-galactonokinase
VGYNTTTLVSDIFTLRSSVLLNQANSDAQHSHLSGMLIGNEIREGLQLMGAVNDVLLVGSDSLCSLYQIAFKTIGLTVRRYTEVAAVSGFQKIAVSVANEGQNQ